MTAGGIELEVAGLTRRYSPQVTVGPISFEVRAGEFFSLLGPSGCGKTTTLRCIAGFETLNAGTIRLQGERLDDKPPHRRDVGLVFQNYALFPHLSVSTMLPSGLSYAASPRRKSSSGSGASCGSSICRRWPSASQRSFRVASSSALRLPALWCSNRAS